MLFNENPIHSDSHGLHVPAADIPAHMRALEMDVLRRGIRAVNRVRQRIAQCRHAQHAPACRHIAFVRFLRSRMINRRARRFRVLQTGDELAAFVFSRIAASKDPSTSGSTKVAEMPFVSGSVCASRL